MNAEQARALTRAAVKTPKSYFDCIISIRQAAKEGKSHVIIEQGSINFETIVKLHNDGFKSNFVANSTEWQSNIKISW